MTTSDMTTSDMTDQLSQVLPVDLPEDLPVLPGAENTVPAVDFETVTQLRGRVASRLSADGVWFEQLDPASARMRTRTLVEEELDSWVAYQVNRGLPAPTIAVEDDLVEAVMAALGGLGRLEPLLARTDVEDIFFTGCEPTMLRLGDGTKVPGPPIGQSDQEVTALVQALGTSLGDGTSREFSAARPLLSLRLKAVGELGARLSAAMDVTPRPCGTIRVHRHVEADLDMLHKLGMVDAPLRAFLRASVLAGAKIFVSGGTRPGGPGTAVHPWGCRCLPGDCRRPVAGLPLHRARQHGRGGHRWHGGAGAGEHRSAGCVAGDGGQGGAVQALRRGRRGAGVPADGHGGRAGRDDRASGADLRRDQPGGHLGAAVL